MSLEEKRLLIEKNNPQLSLTKQAGLLSLSRASFYYQPKVNELDFLTMKSVDEIYTGHPYFGSRRIRRVLKRDYHLPAGRERIQRLMRLLGLEAIYPKKKGLSVPAPGNKIYPYLLRGVLIQRPNQVWGTDITFIRLETGWAYLVALIDWYSRYVLSWQLSSTLETDFCIKALSQALEIATPEIHNSDQGSQFTSESYTARLKSQGIQISMDGRGRYLDNIFTERLWRTVKYENIYLNSYQNIDQARVGLNHYFQDYNYYRPHQSLNDQTPAEVYFGQKMKKSQDREKNNALQCV